MATIQKFEDIKVWQKAREIGKMIMGFISYLKKSKIQGQKFD